MAAPPGQKVVLPPGEFVIDQTFAFGDSWHIAGAGREATRIVVKEGPAVFMFRGAGTVTLEGVTLARRDGGDLLVVHGDFELRVVDSAFVGPLSDDEVLVDAEDVRSWVGVRLIGGIRGGVIRGSEIRNTIYGIVIGDPLGVVIEHNVIRDNRGPGIHFYNSGGAVTRENRFVSNGYGIMVTHDAIARLERNVITGSRRTGIVYGGTAGGIAISNTVEGSVLAGIAIGGAAAPSVVGNTVTANEDGIAVFMWAEPSVEDNTLFGNRATAIVYDDFGAGTALVNSCRDGAIELRNGAAPELLLNTCDVVDLRIAAP
jgi:parallel beta-helix repeat protein